MMLAGSLLNSWPRKAIALWNIVEVAFRLGSRSKQKYSLLHMNAGLAVPLSCVLKVYLQDSAFMTSFRDPATIVSMGIANLRGLIPVTVDTCETRRDKDATV